MSRRWISIAVYAPFLIGLVLFYANYLYIRYDDSPKVILPSPSYEVKYSLCRAACEQIDKQYCSEWTPILKDDKICNYVCDSYLDRDALERSNEWILNFKCASGANSVKELHDCNISCTPMELL